MLHARNLTRLAAALAGICQAAAPAALQVENPHLALRFELGGPGIAVTGIRNRATGIDYLRKPGPVFEVAVEGGPVLSSDTGLVFDSVRRTGAAHATILAHAAQLPLAFELDVDLSRERDAALLRLSLTNRGTAGLALRAVVPRMANLAVSSPAGPRMAMIPQEIGGVVPLFEPAPPGAPLAWARAGSRDHLFFTASDGAVWRISADKGAAWDSPVRLTPPDFAPPGAPLAVAARGEAVTAFVVDRRGALRAFGGGPAIPAELTRPGSANPGAAVAACEGTVFVVGKEGSVWAAAGGQSAAFRAGRAGLAPDGARLGCGDGAAVFVAGADGALHTIARSGGGWAAAAVTPAGVAPPGAAVALAGPGSTRRLIFAGKDGAVWSAPQREGDPPAAALTPPDLVVPGGAIAASGADLWLADRSGSLRRMALPAAGLAQPDSLGEPGGIPPGAPLLPLDRGRRQLVFTGADGLPAARTEFGSRWGPALPVIPPVGMQRNTRIGLPTAMNSLEVASLFDPAGGGLFFADIEGDLDRDVAPLQFTLSPTGVAAYWLANLAPGETVTAPRFAIGVHDSGDWHAAVDYYLARHRPNWRFPDVPRWFRDQGAMYSFSGAGGGGIYMTYPQQNLKRRIGSFHNLPQLLAEAKSLGTSVVFLWDYWEGATEGGRPEYWNKGDYVPRSDMGGPEAFREGVRELHRQGGRVIVYVEPFIIFYYSRVGREKGELWGGRDASGKLYEHYPRNYSMVPSYVPWQDYLARVSEHLVREFDVDGIFLDSWGWQMNWPMQTREGGVLYSPKQYSQGVLAVADRVRAAVTAVKPDAVVIGESTCGPLARHWHGGLSADFAWLAGQNHGRILASPVRYGVPEVNFMVNGRNLEELRQVFAAGHNLALCNGNLPWAAEVRRLVGIRQEYKDALIYGAHPYQPATGDEGVAAYYYLGDRHEVVTVVNISAEGTYSGALRLAEPGTRAWREVLTGTETLPSGNRLPVSIPRGELRVLVRVR